MTGDWGRGAWEALAVTLAEPLRKAFRHHLDEHGCGTGDYRDPRYIGGFAYCPTAMQLWGQLPEGDQIAIA